MLLQGKIGVVLGVANKRSIAWAIARRAAEEGADLIITYQNERLRENVEALAKDLPGSPLLLPCDVANESEIESLFAEIQSRKGGLDFMVHALAFAKKEELDKDFLATTREGFNLALDISAYSLTALTKRAAPLMAGRKASILTLTYLGAERVVPHYNVMGVAKAALESSVRYLAADLGPSDIRVNAISAGPIKTIAAMGISGFSTVLDVVAAKAPMRRNIDTMEVGDAALFFLSNLSRAVTGEVLYVDNGFHCVGF